MCFRTESENPGLREQSRGFYQPLEKGKQMSDRILPPDPRQLSIDFSGRDVGHAMAELAAKHAGEDWRSRAMQALLQHALVKPKLTVEEVRLNCGLEDPPSKRAWGAIALAAQRAGLITSLGTTKVNDGRMFATLWRSNIFGGV